MTVLQRLPVWLGDALPHEDKDGMTMNEEHSQAKNRAALVSLLAACLLLVGDSKPIDGLYTLAFGCALAGFLLTLVSLHLVGSERFLLLSMGLMLGCFYMQYRQERGRVA